MTLTSVKRVSPYGNMLWGVSSKIPLLSKPINPLCDAFKNWVASVPFRLLVKIHRICIRNFCVGIYFGYYGYSCVCGIDISWNGNYQSILLCIYWQSLSQFGSGPLPLLASLCMFVINLRIYWRLLIRCGLLHRWFMDIIIMHWYYYLSLLFRDILTDSATLIWWINECSWWIMFLRIYKHRFLSFYKPTHGLTVAEWNKISIATIDSGKVRIKFNMELWWYPSKR